MNYLFVIILVIIIFIIKEYNDCLTVSSQTIRYDIGDDGFKTMYRLDSNGKSQGRHKSWYPDGIKECECHFKDNILHGKYRCWHDNGQLAVKCRFVNGKLEGLYRSWDPDGVQDEDCHYHNGIEILSTN